MKQILLIALGALVIFTLGHASGPDDRDIAFTEYCSMIALHKDSGGEYGWPPFRGTFEEECKK